MPIDVNIWLVVLVGAIIALLLLIIATGYVKAPPNMAYIITGIRKRIIIGKAAIKIPFFERLDKISLATIQVDVKTSSSVPTADYINVNVDAVVNIKIPTEDIRFYISTEEERIYVKEDCLARAQQNFLNVADDYIIKVAKEVLEGNIREIIGQMRLEDMVSDRQKFAELVKQNAAPDLAELGLMIVSFNVQNFKDDSGVISNLGIDNTERIRKGAAIAKAQAQRDISIAESQARKEANDAQVAADLEIAQKQTDLAVKEAELKQQSETKRAIAEAAYKIQEEEQRKTIEVTTADADIARQEKEVELTEQQARIKERTLEAEIRKVADADKYAAQQRADAEFYTTQKEAEAKKYQDEQNAEAELIVQTRKAEAELVKAQKAADAEKARAEAAKYAALQEAQGIEAKGKAQAEAIKAAALAEAEGLDKKAEAMQKFQSAAVMQMYFDKLPEIAKAIAEPLAQTEKIIMYGEGNGSKMVGDITKSVSQLSEGLLEGTGMSLQSMFSAIMTGKMIGNSMSNAAGEMPTPTTNADIDIKP